MITKSFRVPLWVLHDDWRYRTFLALKLRPGGRLLDVGCGSGQFLRLARAHGYQVTGIDIDNEAVKVAQDRFSLLDTYVLPVEELQSARWEQRFDIICLFDVLEHLDNPVLVVGGLRGLLTHGGYLLCTVPGLERWPPFYDPYVDSPPHHLTLWTPSALERCISAAGLEVVRVVRSPLVGGSLWPHVLWRVRRLLQLGVLGMLVKAVAHFVVAPPVAKVLSLVPKAGGFTLMGVAMRPPENP